MRYREKYVLLAVLSVCVMAAAPAFGYSLSEAQVLERNKDWNGALNYGLAWTRAEPNNSNAWGIVAIAYYIGFNRADLALDPAKHGVALTPKDPGAWTLLGFIYKKLNRYPEEVDALRHPVDLVPQRANFWNNLASAYADAGNYPQVLKTLEQQAQLAGPHQNYVDWYNLGNGFLVVAESGFYKGTALGRDPRVVVQEAVSAYRQSLRLNQRYAMAWTNLGVAEEILGAGQNALNDYQRAASLGDQLGRQNYTQLQQAMAARAQPKCPQVRSVAYSPSCGSRNPFAYMHPCAQGMCSW